MVSWSWSPPAQQYEGSPLQHGKYCEAQRKESPSTSSATSWLKMPISAYELMVKTVLGAMNRCGGSSSSMRYEVMVSGGFWLIVFTNSIWLDSSLIAEAGGAVSGAPRPPAGVDTAKLIHHPAAVAGCWRGELVVSSILVSSVIIQFLHRCTSIFTILECESHNV